MVLVLLTRPESAAHRFADELRTAGCDAEIVISPVLKLVSVDTPEPIQKPAGLIVTSAQAAPKTARWPKTPVFVVGERTSETVVAYGGQVALAAPDGRSLVAQIPDDVSQPLLHIRGTHVAQPIADLLGKRGINCEEWVVYDQCSVSLSDEAKQVFEGDEAIVLPLFSPRSAEVTLSKINRKTNRQAIIPIAMSETIAEVCKTHEMSNVSVAARPNSMAMLEAVMKAVKQARLLEG